MISLAIWIEYTSVTDRQTDGRTDTDTNRRLVSRFSIASGGKTEHELVADGRDVDLS